MMTKVVSMFDLSYGIKNNLRDENTSLRNELEKKKEELSKVCGELLVARKRSDFLETYYSAQLALQNIRRYLKNE